MQLGTKQRSGKTASTSATPYARKKKTAAPQYSQAGIIGVAGTGRPAAAEDQASTRPSPISTQEEPDPWNLLENETSEKERYKKLYTDVKKLKEKHWKQLREQRQICASLAAKQDALPGQLDQVRKEKDALEEKLSRQDSVIQAFQDKSLDEATSGFANDPDNAVAMQVRALFKSVQAWTSKYVSRKWPTTDPNQGIAVFRALTDGSKPAIASPKGIVAALTGQISSRIVATAIVNRDFVWSTLINPFRIIANDRALSTSEDSVNTFRNIHQVLSSGKFAAPQAEAC